MMNTSCSRQGFLSFTDDLRRAGRLIGSRTGRHYRSGSGPCRRHPEPRTSRQSRSSSRAALPSSGCRHTHHHHSWLRWSNNYLLLLPGTSRQYGTCHSGVHQNRHHLPPFKNPQTSYPVKKKRKESKNFPSCRKLPSEFRSTTTTTTTAAAAAATPQQYNQTSASPSSAPRQPQQRHNEATKRVQEEGDNELQERTRKSRNTRSLWL